MNKKEFSIEIDKTIMQRLERYFDDCVKGVSPRSRSFEDYRRDLLSLERAEEQCLFLRGKLPVDFEGKTMLEIGSGLGIFLASSVIKHGIAAYGAEPGKFSYSVSREILASCGISADNIRNDKGEKLSYPSDFFDIVYSSNVLEHVENPEQVFREAIRVLKPGGYLLFVVPNYGSLWEGHYAIPWFPNMPKCLAKFYVRLLGRKSEYIDSLQFVSLKQMQGIVRRSGEQFEVLSWGWDTWERRLATLDFSTWSSLARLKRILLICKKFKLLKALIYFGKRNGWLTPIILFGRKKL